MLKYSKWTLPTGPVTRGGVAAVIMDHPPRPRPDVQSSDLHLLWAPNEAPGWQEIRDRRRREASCHSSLQTRDTNFLHVWMQTLVPRPVPRWLRGVWSAAYATHVSWIHRNQNEVLGVRIFDTLLFETHCIYHSAWRNIPEGWYSMSSVMTMLLSRLT